MGEVSSGRDSHGLGIQRILFPRARYLTEIIPMGWVPNGYCLCLGV